MQHEQYLRGKKHPKVFRGAQLTPLNFSEHKCGKIEKAIGGARAFIVEIYIYCLETSTHILETFGLELKTCMCEFHFKLLGGHLLIY